MALAPPALVAATAPVATMGLNPRRSSKADLMRALADDAEAHRVERLANVTRLPVPAPEPAEDVPRHQRPTPAPRPWPTWEQIIGSARHRWAMALVHGRDSWRYTKLLSRWTWAGGGRARSWWWELATAPDHRKLYKQASSEGRDRKVRDGHLTHARRRLALALLALGAALLPCAALGAFAGRAGVALYLVAAVAALASVGRRPGETLPQAAAPTTARTVSPDRIVTAFDAAGFPGASTEGGARIEGRGPRRRTCLVVNLAPARPDTVADVLKKREALAGRLQRPAPCVHVVEGAHPAQVSLTLFDRDPMTLDPVRSALVAMAEFSLWDPVLIGDTVLGEPYGLVLPGTSGTWICSAPGYGKTNLLLLLLAAAALDRRVERYIHDGKGEGDLAVYGRGAAHYSEGSGDRAGQACAEMLEHLVDLREKRAPVIRRLREERPDLMPSSQITRAVTDNPEFGLPLIVAVVDELNLMAETKAGERIQAATKTLAQAGRSGGIIVIPAGQNFRADVLGGAQSSMGTRIAFRTNSPEDSNIVLGKGQVSEGLNTARWPDNYQGVCIVRPGGVQVHTGAQQVKTHLALMDDHRAVAARAAVLRGLAAGGRPLGGAGTVMLEKPTGRVAGVVEPGERVRISELARRLGVDQREARQLARAEGLEVRKLRFAPTGPGATEDGIEC